MSPPLLEYGKKKKADGSAPVLEGRVASPGLSGLAPGETLLAPLHENSKLNRTGFLLWRKVVAVRFGGFLAGHQQSKAYLRLTPQGLVILTVHSSSLHTVPCTLLHAAPVRIHGIPTAALRSRLFCLFF